MIQANGLTVFRDKKNLLNNISFSLPNGNNLIITGNSGSGKTILAKVLSKKIFAAGSLKIELQNNRSVIFVQQRLQLRNKSNITLGYYQQRFNSFDNEDGKTIEEELKEIEKNDSKIATYLSLFGIGYLKKKPALQLSSGEHKKFQLVKAFLQKPGLLILDEPYIGLDAESRKNLDNLLVKFAAEGVQIVVVSSAHLDLPACFNTLISLENGQCSFFGNIDEYRVLENECENVLQLKNLSLPKVKNDFECAIKMKNVLVKYGENTIINHLNWTVKRNEKWLLTGENGSGKSTLLSLIYADNPQAYANEIYLFDKRRGTGETIWDIKKNIGFVSSELNAYFEKSIFCFQAVASGFFDTIGLFKKINQQQKETVESWMKIFEIDDLKNKLLSTVSEGKQRLVLLARALVKNPPVLILDEPCQGLDAIQTKKINKIIDELAKIDERTIIYVSHYANETPQCLTHKLIMQK